VHAQKGGKKGILGIGGVRKRAVEQVRYGVVLSRKKTGTLRGGGETNDKLSKKKREGSENNEGESTGETEG